MQSVVAAAHRYNVCERRGIMKNGAQNGQHFLHHFLLATYNIDPLNFCVKTKKKFITFANVACYATLVNANVA
jgi:hypothetical protein